MLTFLLAATLSAWKSIGPVGEFANTVAADPVHPGVIYAGTGAGLFKSEDAGYSWRLVGSRPSCSDVTAVAVDPNSTKMVYAATFTHDCIAPGGDGFFRSDDGGETWLAIEIGHPILPLKTAPGVAGRLYVSSENCQLSNGFFVYCTGQLLRTDDFGASFESAFAGLPNSDTSYMDIDASNPRRLWATSRGVFRSDDGGSSWTGVSTLDGIPSHPGIGAIAVDSRNGEVLLLSTEVGVFRSSDGGFHWAAISPTFSISQFLFDRYLPGVVYGVVNSQDVFRSIDDGVTWTPYDNGLNGVSIISQLSQGADRRGTAILYAATGNGVFEIAVGSVLPVSAPSASLIDDGQP